MPDEMIVCPNCGEENLPLATRCVHCGMELESFFQIEGSAEPLGDVERSLTPDENDSLPEVLRQLRQEEQAADFSEEALSTGSDTPESIEGHSESALPMEDEPAEGTPEWLKKVRTRAQEEEDATGELAAKAREIDSIRDEPRRSEVDGEFAAWIARIREQARRENIQSVRLPEENPENSEDLPEWLKRIRDLQVSNEEEEDTQSLHPELTLEVDPTASDLPQEYLGADLPTSQEKEPTEPVEIPPVLDLSEVGSSDEEAQDIESTEPEETAIPSDQSSLSLQDEAASDTEQPEAKAETPLTPAERALEPLLEQVDVSASALDTLKDLDAEPVWTGDVMPDLLLLRDQRERAELFRNLLAEEGKSLTALKTKPVEKSNWGRFVLAALLLTGIILTLIFSPSENAQGPADLASAVAFSDIIDQLTPTDKVLVAFEYQAATSSEMEQIAAPVLQHFKEKQIPWQALTTHPNGLWIARHLLDTLQISKPSSISYLPGARLGLLRLALDAQLPPEGNTHPDLLAEPGTSLQDFDVVLLLSDSSMDTQNWLEQVKPWLPELELLVISTHQEAAALLPYYDSGQIDGYLAGLGEADVFASHTETTSPERTNIRAYQVGMGVMIIMLLLGMISKAEMDSTTRHQKDSGR